MVQVVWCRCGMVKGAFGCVFARGCHPTYSLPVPYILSQVLGNFVGCWQPQQLAGVVCMAQVGMGCAVLHGRCVLLGCTVLQRLSVCWVCRCGVDLPRFCGGPLTRFRFCGRGCGYDGPLCLVLVGVALPRWQGLVSLRFRAGAFGPLPLTPYLLPLTSYRVSKMKKKKQKTPT